MSFKMPVLKDGTLVARAVAHVRAAIWAGALKGGDSLSQKVLAEAAQCSQGVIREATLTLERMGLAYSPHKRGARGAHAVHLTPEYIRSVFQCYEALMPAVVATVPFDAMCETWGSNEAKSLHSSLHLLVDAHTEFCKRSSNPVLANLVPEIVEPLWAYMAIGIPTWSICGEDTHYAGNVQATFGWLHTAFFDDKRYGNRDALLAKYLDAWHDIVK